MTAALDWSPQQKTAIASVSEWHKDGNQPVFRLFGYAGTGKTTIARHLAETVEGKAVFAAFTGKAAVVMQKNGCAGASTIHSLIYKAVQDQNTGEVRYEIDKKSAAADAAVICIDECSMVNEEIGKDLLSFDRPVLVLGDPAQLPPVKGGGFFTDHEPDTMLTEIHRQAEGNPIVRLATDVREGRTVEPGEYGKSRVVGMDWIRANPDTVRKAEQVLVGKNATRHAYNARLRSRAGYEGQYPVEGDRLVCLRNDKTTGIFNGGLFTVTRNAETHDAASIKMAVQSIDFPGRAAIEVTVRRECFDGGLDDVDWRDRMGFQEFDYGYALTVHKSQGSQWGDVVLFDESRVFRNEWRRHLYTGITRAAERVTIVQ